MHVYVFSVRLSLRAYEHTLVVKSSVHSKDQLLTQIVLYRLFQYFFRSHSILESPIVEGMLDHFLLSKIVCHSFRAAQGMYYKLS